MMDGWNYPFSIRQPVIFRDLDALGHVNNAVYLTYLENARAAYGLHLVDGTGLADLSFIVAEATVTYLRQVSFGDELEIGVHVSKIGTKSFTMDYGLRDSRTLEPVARGSTILVWFDYAANRSAPVPAWFRAAVAADDRTQ